MTYPVTRTGSDTDTLAGVTVDDPYRWLEDSDSEEVQLWQKEQNQLASDYARALPEYDRIRELVESHAAARFGTTPRKAADRWFWTTDSPSGTHTVLVASDSPSGAASTVFDPADYGTPAPYLSWFSPSPDGQTLAVGLCTDGSEQNELVLVDLVTGARVPGLSARLMDNWSGGVSWLADSSGFYLTVIDGAAIDLAQRILHYDVPSRVSTELQVAWRTERDYRMLQVSQDGKWLIAYEGLTHPVPIAIASLSEPANPAWRPFVTVEERVVTGEFYSDTYLAVTDVGAPRGRVVAIKPGATQPEQWQTIVPESDAVIRNLTRVGDLLYVSEFVDTYARVRIFDADGNSRGEVPLPGRGAMGDQPFPYMTLVPRGDTETFVFAFSTLTSSWGVYQHVPSSEELRTISAPAVAVEGAVVEDHWATSPDGWRVPYHLVRLETVDTASAQPTMIYAYGGFNAPWVPQFPGSMAAIYASGATFVHAHLRGGGEFGRGGWEAGRKANKQNGYDDLYAVAEDLIAKGRATSQTLAVCGGSNGGLMAGVALIQRPDLWRAVVPRVPLLDLVGACRENYGRWAVGVELADIDDPDDVRRMLTVSPYQLVTDEHYPSVFIDAGATDPRCTPWHARKFGARLQAHQLADNPILIRIWENVGHGWATAKDTALDQSAEWIAFVCRELGHTAL